MIGRRHVGGIEQDQRIPTPADFNGMLHRGPCRHRMEQAGRWPLSELRFHCLNDAFEIACKLLVVMMRRYNRHIVSVIAKIENYQVKIHE